MRLTAFLMTFCAITPVWALICKTDGSGGCVGSSATANDCTSLGFKKDDVAGCKHYLYCPFDQNYKACVAKEDTPSTDPVDECADYPLTSCPANANCSECQSGDTTKYKVNSCKNGYTLHDGKCYETKTCEDYGYVTEDPTSSTDCISSCPSLSVTTEYGSLWCYDKNHCEKDQACLLEQETCEDHGYLSEDPMSCGSCEVGTSLYITVGTEPNTKTLHCYEDKCTVDEECCEQKARELNSDECGVTGTNSCPVCNCTFPNLDGVCHKYTYSDCRCTS